MSESAASADDQFQVLIVDDSDDAAASLVLLLELEDISAQSAPDGETALQLVERVAPPSVLLIDIGLPGMNGYQLAERLRALPRLTGSTLIALTGRDLHPGEKGSVFDQFWTKPFDPKQLLAEVKALLSRSQQSAARG